MFVTLSGGPSAPLLRHTPTTVPPWHSPALLGTTQKHAAVDSPWHAMATVGSSLVATALVAQPLQQVELHCGKATSGALSGVLASTSPIRHTGWLVAVPVGTI